MNRNADGTLSVAYGKLSQSPVLWVRDKLDERMVAEYRDRFDLPPLEVFEIEGELLVADGFHRLEAIRRDTRAIWKEHYNRVIEPWQGKPRREGYTERFEASFGEHVSHRLITVHVHRGWTLAEARALAVQSNGRHGVPLTWWERYRGVWWFDEADAEVRSRTPLSQLEGEPAQLTPREVSRILGISHETVRKARFTRRLVDASSETDVKRLTDRQRLDVASKHKGREREAIDEILAEQDAKADRRTWTGLATALKALNAMGIKPTVANMTGAQRGEALKLLNDSLGNLFDLLDEVENSIPLDEEEGQFMAPGLSKTAEYRAVWNARQRCRSPQHPGYPGYGGRGIEYRLPDNPSAAAAALLAAIGPRPPDHSLDRIDNDGHYELGNLRWATSSHQNLNRRRQDS